MNTHEYEKCDRDIMFLSEEFYADVMRMPQPPYWHIRINNDANCN